MDALASSESVEGDYANDRRQRPTKNRRGLQLPEWKAGSLGLLLRALPVSRMIEQVWDYIVQR